MELVNLLMVCHVLPTNYIVTGGKYMNPVSSYYDFMEFLQNFRDNHDKLIPIVLIKPSVMLYLNQNYLLRDIFRYFDRRTGDNIQFFLPGYYHYPSTAFQTILAEVRPYSEEAVAFTTRRLGTIYYNENNFIEFVEQLENGSSEFIYRGDTELIFLKYTRGEQYNLGSFDFSKINRYNLSNLFYSQKHQDLDEYARLRCIEHFLEDVIFTIRKAGNNEDQLIASINSSYDRPWR